MKTVTCAYCGKEKIIKNDSYYKNKNKRFFCDSLCSVAQHWPTGKNMALCEYCKTSFPKKLNRMKKTTLDFCSYKCRGKHRSSLSPRKFVKCHVCSKPILRTPAQIKKSKIYFCSQRCMHPYLSKLYRKYSSNRIRRLAKRMGCNYKDIEKYPELQDFLEIYALNIELKKTIKEAKTNETNRNQKQRRPSQSPHRTDQRCP